MSKTARMMGTTQVSLYMHPGSNIDHSLFHLKTHLFLKNVLSEQLLYTQLLWTVVRISLAHLLFR